ncbi:hypothetical protein SAMN05421874_109115 [Nonomuraea maritima]|uniref:Uncharacterized protein n=1 Tax=Nonomuraea maritima TaxID=683260 RepID=A0A1G9DFD1_9ACTN|nr:hypothetical protein SAMN05421874_109115 [Nonomuraea maritima]
MKSNKWHEVHLSVTPFRSIYLNNVPELLTVLDDNTTKMESSVIVDVYKIV